MDILHDLTINELLSLWAVGSSIGSDLRCIPTEPQPLAADASSLPPSLSLFLSLVLVVSSFGRRAEVSHQSPRQKNPTSSLSPQKRKNQNPISHHIFKFTFANDRIYASNPNLG
jgi:hypothetical protein